MNDQYCNFLNCNVRGLNNPARRSVVRDLTRDTKATIAAIQETKLDFIDRAIVLETLGEKFGDNFVYLPAQGVRGGILLAVDQNHYHISSLERGGSHVNSQN
jgi:hypothetical protein